MTKVSEIEIEAGDDGSLTDAEPLTNGERRQDEPLNRDWFLDEVVDRLGNHHAPRSR